MRGRKKKALIWILCTAMLFAGMMQFPAYAEDAPAALEEKADPYAYTGFSGIYQQIRVNGKTVKQSNKAFILTDAPAPDRSAQFLPKIGKVKSA